MSRLALLILLAPTLVGSTAALATTATLPLQLSAVAPPLDTPAGHIDPRLLDIADREPLRLIRVMVQKFGHDQHVAQVVEQLGGTLLADLPMINAFAAELSAEAAYQLAQAKGVRWVALDAPVQSTLLGLGEKKLTDPANYYLDTLGVPALWQQGLNGQGIGIAIIDSGIANVDDFTDLALTKGVNLNALTPNDLYGHGTHIAGIVAGNGHNSDGKYRGVAPGATLIGLKVSDDLGLAFESDVVKALQWVYDNKDRYNIRIINLSINAGAEVSYHASPLNAAAEILWFSGVVVVVSAGNSGEQHGYNTVNAPPANDPFVITVGASDERGTSDVTNDVIAAYSAYDITPDGFLKPDIIAPGTAIYSVRAPLSPWAILYPTRLAGKGHYFRLSGTSMAAPMVVGTVALMLQAEPSLTPDQVKYRLLHGTDRMLSAQLDGREVSFPYLHSAEAVNADTTASANTGLPASQLLWTGSSPINWSSVNWNSVNWNSVNWNSVNWNSVNWNSVNWNSAVLEPPTLGDLLSLAPEEGWQLPALPTQPPVVEQEDQDEQQFSSYLFLPTLAHE